MEKEKLREAKIAEEKRIEEGNQRTKEREMKFDAEQKKKQQELIKKFEERDDADKQEVKEDFSNDERH